MLLRQIEYFVKVVDKGSFTEAAEECYISQSAVSQQILSLEKEMGVQLLVRNTRQLSLTEAGQYLYNHGKQLLNELEKLKKGTLETAGHENRSLVIGYLNGHAEEGLFKAAELLKQQHKDVRLEVIGAGYNELSSLLRSGRADVIFNLHKHVPPDEYVQQQAVSLPCYAEISNIFEGCQNNKANLRDLKKLPCIFVADERQQQLSKSFYGKLLGFNGTILFAHNTEEAHFMAVAGNGFWVTDNIVRHPGAVEGVRLVPLYRGSRQLYINYYLYWKKNNANKYLHEFVSMFFSAHNNNGSVH